MRLSLLISLVIVLGSCKQDKMSDSPKPKATYNVVSGLENSGEKTAVAPPPKPIPPQNFNRDKSLPLIDQVNVENPEFKVSKKKEEFDQIVAFLGSRTINGKSEDLKFRLFMWEDKIRGYYETVYGETSIQIFGYKDGNNIALKSKNNSVPQENGASMVGTLIGDELTLNFQKGQVGEDGVIKVKKTDIDYQLIFYRTEDLIKYGKK